MTNELPPSTFVRVKLGFGSPEYIVTACTWHGWELKEWFLEIGDLLAGRSGWHCELTAEGVLWSFGPFGASLFNISPPKDAEAPVGRFALFDYDADESIYFEAVQELRMWLDANEHRHANHVHKMRDMISMSDWAVLTKGALEARVDFAEGLFIGTVPSLPAEATFARTLAELVNNLRELVGAAVGAPADVTARIRLRVLLEPDAAAAVTG